MHDVIIIGAGPGGLSAALWCDDLGLDALVLEREGEVGGQLLRVHNRVENYLGVEAADGRELRDLFAAQAEGRDFDLWTQAEIEEVDLRAKRVRLRSGEELTCIALVLATGVRRRRLGVPGEQEFEGRGVLSSGALERDSVAGEDVLVVGGGDAAAENALLLAETCATVTLVHRGAKLSARREFAERIRGDHRITVFAESTLERVLGSDKVESVEIRRAGALKAMRMAVRGVLIRAGVEPNSELFRGQLHTDARGYVVTDGQHETSAEMVFAVGDISNPRAPTVSGAAGAGATAAKVIASRLVAGG
ncbi:MAG TPA: FAD-dependent oxidoreductase [Pyrinomonadaceae bacterium]|nr:FAD-dependent oxidoreductase [Pyrinomonadaceae bacterium]